MLEWTQQVSNIQHVHQWWLLPACKYPQKSLPSSNKFVVRIKVLLIESYWLLTSGDHLHSNSFLNPAMEIKPCHRGILLIFMRIQMRRGLTNGLMRSLTCFSRWLIPLKILGLGLGLQITKLTLLWNYISLRFNAKRKYLQNKYFYLQCKHFLWRNKPGIFSTTR